MSTISEVGACRYCRHDEHDSCKQIGWKDTICCGCDCSNATAARDLVAGNWFPPATVSLGPVLSRGMDRLIREAKAEAWDEGAKHGTYRTNRGEAVIYDIDNPYRSTP